ncbi:MAG: DNA replication/repair protein RecF [Candidatus Nanopelagicales bacterium]
MWVQALQLGNFRSYRETLVEFLPGVNILIGSNGQGKTNVVEAIYYLATLNSHRVANESPLVTAGETSAVIRARVNEHDRAVAIDLEITPGKTNRGKINRSPLPRVRDILGIVRVIMFAPEDLALVKGDPSERRSFLDQTLIQRAPRYMGVKSDYEKVLRQRNALLKSTQRENIDSTLDVWNEQLARIGAEIAHTRIQFIRDLTPFIHNRYHSISGGENAVSTSKISLAYQSKYLFDHNIDLLTEEEIRIAILEELTVRRKEELTRGITLVGPHRDELFIGLGDLPLKGYASHGESWSAALALRVASADVLRADGIEPILILDDVFAELDVMRRATILELTENAPQVFITAAVESDIPEELGGARFFVSLGSVVPIMEDQPHE